MNTAIATETVPTTIGTPFGGGHTAGRILVDRRPFVIIIAPKAPGSHKPARWNKNTKSVEGAASFFDGLANTRAMAEAGSKIAKWALGLDIEGFADWYIPSRDELEICYRAFKPTKEKNWVYRNGENPSSLPPGYPYTEDFPAQTSVQRFRADDSKRKGEPAPATEAFEPAWHWSSTDYAGGSGYAWIQTFGGGGQDGAHKGTECPVRAVRRIPI